MEENTESVIIQKKSDGYSITIVHDQSGSGYGIDISDSAYAQLAKHFADNKPKNK